MKNQLSLNAMLVLALTMILPLEGIAANTNTTGTTQTSTADAQTALATLFTKIDTNVDNYLSLSEVQAWRESAQVEHFNTLDADKSTTLSLAELQAGAPAGVPTGAADTMSSKLFTLLDGDKNSALTWEEFSVMEPGKGEIIRHFAEMDSDADSQLSQTEFLTNKPSRHGPGGHHGGGVPPTAAASTATTTTTTNTAQ
jgi:Ca2+-binding EF-hand superfamily protein